MVFPKSSHPFCLEFMKMIKLYIEKIARFFIYFGKKIGSCEMLGNN